VGVRYPASITAFNVSGDKPRSANSMDRKISAVAIVKAAIGPSCDGQHAYGILWRGIIGVREQVSTPDNPLKRPENRDSSEC